MGSLLVSVALSGLGREAVRIALGLVVAAILAAAFVTSALAALVTSALDPAALLTSGPPLSAVALAGTGPRPALYSAVSRRAAATADAVPAGTAEDALRAARAAIGTPYVWGGTDPRTGVDCSGLVMWAYRRAGIALPRTAQAQFDATLPARPDELRPGDLVFFQHLQGRSDRADHPCRDLPRRRPDAERTPRRRARPGAAGLRRLLGSPLRRRGPRGRAVGARRCRREGMSHAPLPSLVEAGSVAWPWPAGARH